MRATLDVFRNGTTRSNLGPPSHVRSTEQIRRSLSRLMSGAVGTAAFDADGTLVGSSMDLFHLHVFLSWSYAT